MTRRDLMARLRSVAKLKVPLPGGGATAKRHRLLMEIGREDLALGSLAEAHFDALAILAEANRKAEEDAVYGVWASELPGHQL